MDFLEILPSIPILFLGFVVWYAKKLNAKIEESASEKDVKAFMDKVEKKIADGIKSGEETREKQMDRIIELKEEVASIEGYLSNTNGYLKRNV